MYGARISTPSPRLQDAYDAWRSAATRAADALALWAASPSAVRRAAFSAYTEALDREERAASALERQRQTVRLLSWHR